MQDIATSPRRSLSLTHEFLGATVVFLVALPLCLGIALASNAPLISGLLAGIVGGIVVGILSGSSTSVSGPAAGLTAVIALQITTLGSFEAFLPALIIAGVIQILMGIVRLGFIAAFFPSSVIKGLLAAIGVILVLKQLPHLVGWDMDFDGEMAFWQHDHENTFSAMLHIFQFHSGAALVGLISLSALIAWDRIPFLKKSLFPAPLAIVILGVLANMMLPYLGGSFVIEAEHSVQVPVTSGITEFLSLMSWPDWSQLLSTPVYIAGITLALVASLETLLNLDAIDKIDPLQRVSPPNRELIAQGVGNTLLGFIGGIPVTSVVIRGSVNVNSGAKTKISTITHGVLLLSCVLLLPTWLNQIPLACLAAILIMTGIKLASPKIIRQMWEAGINQFLPFAVTVLAIVFTDLLVGVMIGLTTSIAFILHSNWQRPIRVIKEQQLSGVVWRIQLANQVSFLNRAALNRVLEQVPEGSHILLDARDTEYIDADILDLIQDFKSVTAPAHGVKVSLLGFKEKYQVDDVIQYAEYATHEVQRNMTPLSVLKFLKEGNKRVRSGQRLHRDLSRQINATSTGQFPLAVVLSCIDSRASVELIFDLGIGDVFSVRMAGNVISEKVLGSLEFACAVAGAKLIVVMGHTRCGAVSAALEFFRTGVSAKEATGCEHLGAIVHDVQKVVRDYAPADVPPKNDEKRESFEDQIVQKNVLECMDRIMSQSATLRQLVAKGQIAIAGCIYDVKSGAVEFLREFDSVVPDDKTPSPDSFQSATP